jgi:hypothetical protein
VTDDVDPDSRDIVRGPADRRGRAGQQSDADVADWIWARSGIDLDIDVEASDKALTVIVGGERGVELAYPFPLDELWSAVDELEDEIVASWDDEDEDED